MGAYDWTWRKGSSDIVALNEYINTRKTKKKIETVTMFVQIEYRGVIDSVYG